MYNRNPISARLGQEILPLQMGYLPEFYTKKAEVELNENPKTRQKNLKVLRDMVDKDEHLHDMNLDDETLLQYLRCRKHDTERAYAKLKAFAILCKRNKSAFMEYNFENLSMSARKKIITFLPYRCQDGCTIILFQLDNWVPEEVTILDLKRAAITLLQLAEKDPMTQVNGFKVIFDAKSNPIKHIRHATPNNIHLLYYGPQECSPARYKGIHIVNQSLTFRAAWMFLKPFLSAKMKSRIHTHSSLETLLDFFPAACLPVEYGGDLQDYGMDDWLSVVLKPEKIEKLGGGKHPVK